MKILGKNMDNIVVDNRFTAIKCMEFLKKTYEGDKFSTFETFLPLDYISRKTFDDTILR
jgi:chromosome segregation ATPase